MSIGSPAWAGVGVTSGADGDPLGKPPNENERILRIGIDVQANELITTSATDRAHLVFLDGSSLTVGPDARLTIDKFVFDPNTKKGELAINASKGVLRLVGGKISKSNAITITTPSSTIGIRGGITIVSVSQVQTIADFVFGSSMTVTAAGQTQTATRAGSQITSTGGVPSAATLVKAGAMIAALSQLEGDKFDQQQQRGSVGADFGFLQQEFRPAGQDAGHQPEPAAKLEQQHADQRRQQHQSRGPAAGQQHAAESRRRPTRFRPTIIPITNPTAPNNPNRHPTAPNSPNQQSDIRNTNYNPTPPPSGPTNQPDPDRLCPRHRW